MGATGRKLVVIEWIQATTGGTQTVLVGFLQKIRVRIRALEEVIDHGRSDGRNRANAAPAV